MSETAAFDRRLVCILGLAFDVVTVEQAVERIRGDAFAGRRCFVSTPNLNFVTMAQADSAFRDAVLRSDLCLVDGMPLVWMARLLGLPVPERVSGADVFEALQAHPGPSLSVYLFGGPRGVAERACVGINRRGGGLRCVGFDSPGFGSIESMSDDEQIARINASGAHFVVASLGAKKGQAWLMHNAARLTAPVLSHLGAVVNFAAGGVRRAPPWMRKTGLEWLWRIGEEPALWRRYGGDAGRFAGLLMRTALANAVTSRTGLDQADVPSSLEVLRGSVETTLVLRGSWQAETDLAALRTALRQCALHNVRVALELSAVTFAGNAFVALLLLAHGWFSARSGFRLTHVSAAVTRGLRRCCAEHVFAIAEP